MASNITIPFGYSVLRSGTAIPADALYYSECAGQWKPVDSENVGEKYIPESTGKSVVHALTIVPKRTKVGANNFLFSDIELAAMRGIFWSDYQTPNGSLVPTSSIIDRIGYANYNHLNRYTNAQLCGVLSALVERSVVNTSEHDGNTYAGLTKIGYDVLRMAAELKL